MASNILSNIVGDSGVEMLVQLGAQNYKCSAAVPILQVHSLKWEVDIGKYGFPLS